jgi:hypothetical protein
MLIMVIMLNMLKHLLITVTPMLIINIINRHVNRPPRSPPSDRIWHGPTFRHLARPNEVERIDVAKVTKNMLMFSQ